VLENVHTNDNFSIQYLFLSHWFSDDKFLEFYSCSHKNVQSDRIYVSVRVVGLSHVRARQFTSTSNLQNGRVLDRKTPDFMSPCCLVLT